jgi:hypothetical protein
VVNRVNSDEPPPESGRDEGQAVDSASGVAHGS